MSILLDIILIDDNRLDNLINQKTIEKSGIAKSIVVFSSPTEAVETLLGSPPDGRRLIFLDIQMPLLTGFDVLERLQELSPEVLQNLEVIMVSSSINPGDQERAKNFFPLVKDFIHKPLTTERLFEALNELREA